MRLGVVVPALVSGISQGIHRLAEPHDHRRGVLAAAIVVSAAAVVFVESHFGAFGHGTHLLYLLLLVMGGALIVGPGPAMLALSIGALGTGAAWALGMGPADSPLKVVAQLGLFLAVGMAYLGVLLTAIRTRQAMPGAGTASAAPTLPRRALLEPLRQRELEILRLVGTGKTSDEIAGLLFLSPNTVKTHLSHIYAKLAARSRTDAIRVALECGCMTIEDICTLHPVAMAPPKRAKG